MAGITPIGGKKQKSYTAEQTERIIARSKRRYGVNWTLVDPDLLRAVLWSATSAGHMIAFSEAAGGVGVRVTVWIDRAKEYEVCVSTDDLAEYLANILAFCDGDGPSTLDPFRVLVKPARQAKPAN